MRKPARPAKRAASIAVLPFTNRSPGQEAMFVDGVHDELLTSLAKVGSLKVISRTSVMEYRNTTKNLREIGRELQRRGSSSREPCSVPATRFASTCSSSMR